MHDGSAPMTRRIPRRPARAPISLFRIGLGRLLGRRVAMIEHRGRITGLPRQVVLEVVAHGPGHIVVVSGYGTRAQWYRNIVADAHVRLWCNGARGASATALALSPGRTSAILHDYRRQHPFATRTIGRLLGLGELITGGPLPPDLPHRLPAVEFILDTDGDDRPA
jgi:deazaflavin-dependent oxidoreductase (nitroreductase family)